VVNGFVGISGANGVHGLWAKKFNLNRILGALLMIRAGLTLVWCIYIFRAYRSFLNATALSREPYIAQDGSQCYTSVGDQTTLWCSPCPSAIYVSWTLAFISTIQFFLALDFFAYNSFFSTLLVYYLPVRVEKNKRIVPRQVLSKNLNSDQSNLNNCNSSPLTLSIREKLNTMTIQSVSRDGVENSQRVENSQGENVQQFANIQSRGAVKKRRV